MRYRDIVALAVASTLLLCGCNKPSDELSAPTDDAGGIEYSGDADTGDVPEGTDDAGGGSEDTSGDAGKTDTSSLPPYESESVEGALVIDDEWFDRKIADDTVMRGILGKILTWDSKSSYETARGELFNRDLGVRSDSDFAKALFPEEYAKGTNMRFLGLDSYVMEGSVSSDVTYFALARVQSDGKNDFKANGEIGVTYTVSKSGAAKILDMVPIGS